jgi:hypothetical protein
MCGMVMSDDDAARPQDFGFFDRVSAVNCFTAKS